MMSGKHPEILFVTASTDHVACNGGGGALGHPKVYYTFHGQDEVVCGYCNRLFTRKNAPGAQPYKGAA